MRTDIISMALAAMAILPAATPASAQTEETWKPIGNGTFRDDLITAYYFISDYYEFPVEMEESEQTPGRYRLVDAYRNCPSIGGPAFPTDVKNYVVVDASDPAHVYIEPGCLSYYIGEDQAFGIWSIADDYFNNLYGNWERADEEGVCGKLEDGVITFPNRAVLVVPMEGTTSYDPSSDYIWKQANANGMFRLKLPGTPDTDIAITYAGASADLESVIYDLTFSDDLEYVKVGVFEGEYNPSMRTDVEEDKVPTYTYDKSCIAQVPYEKDGIYTLVAVPYAGGRSYAPTWLTREWSFSEAEWKKIGKGTYTEAILSSNTLSDYGFIIPAYEYEVEVEQNVADPVMIRLVNPYSPEYYPYATSINYDSERRHDIYFDLTYFDCVLMLHTEDIGLDLGSGTMSVRSMSDLYTKDRPYADRNMTMEEYMSDDSLPKCKYDPETQTITFERKALRILFPDARPDAWYDANINGTGKLVLPKETVIPNGSDKTAELVIDTDMPTEYYTVDGIKVDADRLHKGIYIVRRGREVSKIAVD